MTNHLNDLEKMRTECSERARGWQIGFILMSAVAGILLILNILLVNNI